MELLLAAAYRSHGALAAEEITSCDKHEKQKQNGAEHCSLPVPGMPHRGGEHAVKSFVASRSSAWPRGGRRGHAFDQLSRSGDPALGGRRTHLLAFLGATLHFLQLIFGKHDQTALVKIAVLTHGLIAGVLGDELIHAADNLAVGVLDIDEQRAGKAVAAVSDRIKARRGAADLHTLKLVLVLVQERVTEDAERLRIGFNALHDQIVVLTGLDEGAVLAHGRALLFDERLVVALLKLALLLLEEVERFAALVHGKFDESVARAGSRRRAIDRDHHVRKRLVDIAPLLVRVRHQLVAVRNLGPKSEEDLLLAEIHRLALLGLGDGKAVIADQELGDVRDSVLGAKLKLRLLHSARRAGDIRVVLTDALAKDLHAATGTGGLDNRSFLAGLLAEFLGDRLGIRKHRRGTDDLDLITSQRWAGRA